MNPITHILDFQSQALTLRSERQRVLASNIANADTPGYAARELDFSSALRQATRDTPSGPVATQRGHLGTSAAHGNLVYAARSQVSLDGNTVDLDRERASFADNAIKYEATLRFMNDRIKTMMSAITGQ